MVSNVFDAMGMGCCLLRRWRLVAELGRWCAATGKLSVNGDVLAGFLDFLGEFLVNLILMWIGISIVGIVTF